MSNKMLIDASHPEETRVIVTRGNKIEEFDFESEHKKQLKGNIYLARVTRVEPSLQAAFVEYGGNRHGFLAFSEIHPDYYQIPVADRLALLEAEAKAARAEDDDEDEQPRARTEKPRRNRRRGRRDGQNGDAVQASTNADSGLPAAEPVGPAFADYVAGTPAIALMGESYVISEPIDKNGDDNHDDDDHDDDNGDSEEDQIDSVGSEDALEELPSHNRTQRRQYNIQDVIKRRQILLVQVVKEERGNKGAALTTYLSLAGRYSVLMPNTARGGGISRKITNIQDRKRLKDIVKELEVPQGMGVILRTAGANRTKAEVRRDYEYLMRMWENVRTRTLESTAPALVYEEGSLIKRSIRDLYNKDISEILVSGESGYREAKDFMRMLMPSHGRVVQPYRDPLPIFARNGIEGQLDRMLLPQVTLKSGGYIIINQTEALVAVDVNSGRSTREHSIEDTALQTNLEAAEEVARQLRLRDLAGLIVVDFIDMEEKRNNRAVEKKMKDCLKDDRARIQVGRISHFGLLEMSRQRIRASVLESTMQSCPHCGGTGHIRSDSSMSLHVIRAIEDYLLRHAGYDITVRTPAASALYVLNHKRQVLADLENRFGVNITIDADESVGQQNLVIDRGSPSTRPIVIPATNPADLVEDDFEDPEIPVEEDEIEDVVVAEVQPREERPADDGDRNKRRRRRRRGGKGRDDQDQNAADGSQTEHAEDGDDTDESDAEATAADHAASEEERRKKRRRGRRGGRKNRRDEFDGHDDAAVTNVPDAEPVGFVPVLPVVSEQPVANSVIAVDIVAETVAEAIAPVEVSETIAEEAKPAAKPTRRRTNRTKAADEVEASVTETPAEDEDQPAAKPARKPRTRKAAAQPVAQSENTEPAVETPAETEAETVGEADAEKPARKPRVVKAAAAEDVTLEQPEETTPVTLAEPEPAPLAAPEPEVQKPQPARVETQKVEPKKAEPQKAEQPAAPVVTSSDADESKPKRGWWQKKGFF